MPQFVILGAGPTGLGAATRLEELGCRDWLLLERESLAGGLAGSFTDPRGFTWDLGGHVQFSHYDYFDRLMDDLLGKDGWIHHEREAWVWMRERFIPYPFQNNIRHLPNGEMAECVRGIVQAVRDAGRTAPRNFAEFFEAAMGAGIARVFMRPYNFKVWAYPPEELDYHWVGERVSVVDLERVLDNIFHAKDDISWGPNNTFRFPKTGGTGSIWRECARRLPCERLRLGSSVEYVDTARRRVRLSGSGEEIAYENLISSVPLDVLVRQSDLAGKYAPLADLLVHSSTNIVGLGMRGTAPAHLKTKCWMYFPEDDNPFYRVTVFSNYSPGNVPDPATTWSLMAEVSESPSKPVDQARLLRDVVQGAINTRLIASEDEIVDTWTMRLEYGYPTPSLRRDEALRVLLPELDARGVYSRGRFGAWKYEVSNQDHSLMQGVEAVNRVVLGVDEQTVWYPNVVNGPKPWKKR